jgi:glycosyltransferase involved in cell wall biosynthesis
MPNFNKAGYIPSAIKSVLSQTFSNLELIIVDDSSTDGSLKIMAEFAKEDSRVILVSQPFRKGVSSCINAGIRISRSDVVTFIGSDDVYSPDKLDMQYRALGEERTPVVVYGDWWLMDELGNRLPPLRWEYCRKTGMILKDVLAGVDVGAKALIMLPKKCFDLVGFFDESLPFSEDFDMVLRLARNYRFKYLDEQLYGYRQYPGTTTNTMTRRQRLGYRAAVLDRHFKANAAELDATTSKSVKRLLIKNYFGSGNYSKAVGYSIDDSDLFWFFVGLVRTNLVESLKPRLSHC